MSLSATQRIWAAHHLQPQRLRTFRRATDPACTTKSLPSGLSRGWRTWAASTCTRPPMLRSRSIEEKTQIQPLDRIQAGLPLKPGSMLIEGIQ